MQVVRGLSDGSLAYITSDVNMFGLRHKFVAAKEILMMTFTSYYLR